MTRDAIPGFLETERFLDHRLEEAGLLAGTLEGLQKYVGFTMQASVNLLRSKGVRI